jgi:hypothetical protein
MSNEILVNMRKWISTPRIGMYYIGLKDAYISIAYVSENNFLEAWLYGPNNDVFPSIEKISSTVMTFNEFINHVYHQDALGKYDLKKKKILGGIDFKLDNNIVYIREAGSDIFSHTPRIVPLSDINTQKITQKITKDEVIKKIEDRIWDAVESGSIADINSSLDSAMKSLEILKL